MAPAAGFEPARAEAHQISSVTYHLRKIKTWDDSGALPGCARPAHIIKEY